MTLTTGARAFKEGGEDDDREGLGLSTLCVDAGAASHRQPSSLGNLGWRVSA